MSERKLFTPVPLCGWDGTLPNGLHAGDKIDLNNSLLQISGKDKSLRKLRFLSSDLQWGSRYCGYYSKVFVINKSDNEYALALAPFADESIFSPAQRASVIRIGNQPPQNLSEFTFFCEFRRISDMCYGGGYPPFELNGTLLSIKPGLRIYIQGRGRSTRQPHIPVVVLGLHSKDKHGIRFFKFRPKEQMEIPLRKWISFALACKINKCDNTKNLSISSGFLTVSLWINGKKYELQSDRKTDNNIM
ncbi:MAG: hypothetical protein D6707_01110, partial [Bacteroidetes bacterium]